ncbi:MAG: hypothetical protein HY596_01300 [Candidatus Omnitrophica bacterium]|nr:hypothetical protein [Candidatus Omnitrophota bacterium]
MIHIIRDRATAEQMRQMLEVLGDYIKLAVDVRRTIIAGGGGMHADCEAALLEDGSQQADVWGADWVPEGQEVRFESLINIRPRQHNRSMTIEDKGLRANVEHIVRQRIQG